MEGSLFVGVKRFRGTDEVKGVGAERIQVDRTAGATRIRGEWGYGGNLLHTGSKWAGGKRSMSEKAARRREKVNRRGVGKQLADAPGRWALGVKDRRRWRTPEVRREGRGEGLGTRWVEAGG